MKKRDRRKRQTITAQAASKLVSTETSKELARPLRRYQSSCEPDKDLPCKEPCEASGCWEYVCYKCEPRRVTPNSKFPEITTQWSKCDDDRGDTQKSASSAEFVGPNWLG
jgi:hypothetical protein